MDTEYTIYFKGETLDGFDPDKVTNNFSTLFHLPQEKAAVFFNGKTRALKKGLTQEKTKLLIQTLNKAGLKVYIKKEVALPQEDVQAESKLSLLPLGADVLTANERPTIQTAAIDISHLQVCPTSEAFGNIEASQIDTILSTSHLTAAGHYERLEETPPISTRVMSTGYLAIVSHD